MPLKYNEIRNALKELATVERFHGKWIKDDNVVDILKSEMGGGMWARLDKDVLNRATGKKWSFIRTTSTANCLGIYCNSKAMARMKDGVSPKFSAYYFAEPSVLIQEVNTKGNKWYDEIVEVQPRPRKKTRNNLLTSFDAAAAAIECSPTEAVDCPTEAVDCPTEAVDCPTEAVDEEEDDASFVSCISEDDVSLVFDDVEDDWEYDGKEDKEDAIEAIQKLAVTVIPGLHLLSKREQDIVVDLFRFKYEHETERLGW
jgi:hypothetical protein